MTKDKDIEKSVEGVVGDRSAKASMWATAEARKGPFKLMAGSSVTLTCNQDNTTIKIAQYAAQALALEGLRDMMGALETQLEDSE
jgi:hypothetical protein